MNSTEKENPAIQAVFERKGKEMQQVKTSPNHSRNYTECQTENHRIQKITAQIPMPKNRSCDMRCKYIKKKLKVTRKRNQNMNSSDSSTSWSTKQERKNNTNLFSGSWRASDLEHVIPQIVVPRVMPGDIAWPPTRPFITEVGESSIESILILTRTIHFLLQLDRFGTTDPVWEVVSDSVTKSIRIVSWSCIRDTSCASSISIA